MAKRQPFSDELAFRHLIHSVTDPELLETLKTDPVSKKDALVLYGGFEPSASSLHVGSLLLIMTLYRFIERGHKPIVLVGGATGLIGDPGGKTEERKLVSREELKGNIEGIREELERLLAPAGGFELVNNATWLEPVSVLDFLRDVGKHFTVNQMVTKESVRARMERPESGISFTEFSYMLLQAYDFLHLYRQHGCTLQLGGSDQWGNITMGVELIRRVEGAKSYGLTTPLVTKSDGTKFGKTEAGTVWLDPKRTSPYKLYQFFLGSEDSLVCEYLRFFTLLGSEEIESYDTSTADRPQDRAAQKRLAHEICAFVHGEDEALRAQRSSEALFSGNFGQLSEDVLLDAFSDSPSASFPRQRIVDGFPIIDALVLVGLVSSKAEARRTVAQGGAYVNAVRIEDEGALLRTEDLLCDRFIVMRKGKREQFLLRVE